MAERPNRGILRFLLLATVYLVGIAVDLPHRQARAEAVRQASGGLVSAGSHAILAGGRVKVGQSAMVDGAIHSNDLVELKPHSEVRGDVSAVKEVKQDGVVTGRVVEHASAIQLPTTPSKNEASAQANRRLNGPVRLIDPIIDDVLFVSGAVTIEGAARGSGTLIATGTIVVKSPADGASPPPVPPARFLSILTYANLSLEARAVLRATVRTAGRATLGERANLEGSIVADREVELARSAIVRFESDVDAIPPSLTILGPPEPFVTAQPSVDITLLYADPSPGIDHSSFSLLLDGSPVTDQCSTGSTVAFCSLSLQASGPHSVVGSVRDLAGNGASRTLAFDVVLDALAPVVTIESPSMGSLVNHIDVVVQGLATDDGQLETVMVGGVLVSAPGGHFTHTVLLEDGDNVIAVAARDSVGRGGEASTLITLDREPPRLSISAPETVAAAQRNGSGPYAVSTHLASIVVAGVADDPYGVARVEVAGVAVDLVDGRFEEEVALEAGLNPLTVSTVDRAGNVTSIELVVDRSTAPLITIVEPADGAIALEPAIAVRGAVSDPDAAVSVNGHVATLSGTSFVFDPLVLGDGATLIDVVAVSPSGQENAAGVTVLRDVDPPQVVIHDPANGSVVYAPEVAVIGMVNDVVVGTVNGAQVTVTVNGTGAEVADRSFLLDRLPLALGENTIDVTAIDRSGNVAADSVVVRRESPVGTVLSVVSGDRQIGVIGEALPFPLVVALRDQVGAPVVGHLIRFRADGSDGFFGGGKREVVVATNSGGRASVMLTLGRRAGHHSVRADAVGTNGEALFVVRALPGEPAVMVVDSGDQQVGVVGQALRAPFAAVVTDDGFNRLEGALVRFEVIEGDGVLQNGERSMELVSDSDGRVAVQLTLGSEEGVGNNVTRARLVDGPPDAEATFAASARVARDPASTSVSGVVLDNTDLPVPGATITLEGTTLSTRSDTSGFFRLNGVPVGTRHLRVGGSTVERAGVWPSLEFLITIISGVDNSMGRPIFLPLLETENALAVDESTGGVLTIADLPGFALEIAPGSVTFPGGRRSGTITVTPVHTDKVPMPPNFGQQPRFVITIQPGGARFDPPVRVTYPNVDGLLPGQVTELYSFDHDLARFVGIGPGVVSDDGTRVVSAPGVGIAKAGWHGGGDPARPGTCHDCGECRQPSGGACVADDSRTPTQKAPDDCLQQVCRSGSVVDNMTNQEPAKQVEGNCYEELCAPQVRSVDLADAPPALRCCGDPTKPLPGGVGFGVLTGIYAPADECCVQNGAFIIARHAPIDLDLCPEPIPPEMPIEVSFDGCSVPLSIQPGMMFLDPRTPYSGNPDEPTPPANGEALFSRAGVDPSDPMGPCDLHDRCYQTCGSERSDCDGRFDEDLMGACSGLTGTLTVPAPSGGFDLTLDRREVCQGWASLYAFTVTNAAGFAHARGQESHCDCECS